MTALDVLRSARAVLAGARTGPTLFEVCDPLLRGAGGGDQHLRRFYKTAVANPVLRLLLGRAGLPQLREEARLRAVQEAIRTARDAAGPDWGAVAKPMRRPPPSDEGIASPRPTAIERDATASAKRRASGLSRQASRSAIATFVGPVM